MSIATEYARLKNAKEDIKAYITSRGITVPDGTKLDGMTTLLEQISGFDDTIVEFEQVNDTAKSYLSASAGYTDSDYTAVTVASNYPPDDKDDFAKTRPAGYGISVEEAGTLYIVDETTGKGFESISVNAGTKVVYNLIPSHIYRYFVMNSAGKVTQSGRLKSTGTLRMIYVDGCYNFRDLGGWACDGGTIKYGLLLRGGHLGYATPYVTVLGKKQFRDFGILCECDLRNESENGENTPDDPTDDITRCLAADYVDYKNFKVPFSSYAYLLGSADLPTTVGALRYIMDNAVKCKPTYIHCASGADRTGIICLFLEALLGVSCADCSRDYEITAMTPNLTDRLRTGSAFTTQADYINTFDGDTFCEKAAWWAVQAGIKISEINAFRAAMSTGTPETLSFAQSISAALNGCISDNSATSIEWGESYQATLTVSDSTYLFDSISVIMDGVDITASATKNIDVSSNSHTTISIEIEKVTGAISIVASASEPEVVYSITNNLTKCTTDNNIESVSGGNSYTANITPNTYRDIDTITVTMGGTDITSTAVSGSAILISNVSGDVVITATTKLRNIIKDVGYNDGYRWSGSSNALTAYDGASTTGAIPIKEGDVIRFSGGFDWTGSNNPYGFHVFNSAGSWLTYTNPVTGSLAAYGNTITLTDDGNDLVATVDHIATSANAFTHIRVAGKGTGEDMVVTIEQL